MLACSGAARADDARAGSVEWSDGHRLAGAISLTPGRSLHLFTGTGQVAVSLDEVKEIHFTSEKEEVWEGFYFPNAGQATRVKTGEIYPICYLQTEITLADGRVVVGYLFTTALYVETDDTTKKVVLAAKLTGAYGQKLADLVYPALVSFDAGAASGGSSQIDLTQAGFVLLHPPVILAQPDLAQPPMEQAPGKPIWTVPVADPGKIIFAVGAADGIHVTWPGTEADPAVRQTVKGALKVMQDFYDTRTLLGCFAGGDGSDIYSLVMMKRMGKSVEADGSPSNPNIIAWSLIMLRWKYDPEQKKVTLLNRVGLATGHAENSSPLPAVFKEPELLKDISGKK